MAAEHMSGIQQSGASRDESALKQAIDIVYKRRDDGFIVFALVFAIALVYTFTTTPLYEARAQLLIEIDAPNVVSFEEVVEQNRASTDYYQTQYRILQSRSLAKRALDAAGLWQHPSLRPQADAASGASRWFSPERLFSAARGWTWSVAAPHTASEARQASETDVQAQVIDAFLQGLAVAPVRNSRLVEIRYTSPDPALTAAAANALAKAYIDQNLEFKSTASREASEWLRDQMTAQRKAVEESEVALQQYREQYDAISLAERQNIVIQRLADLNAAVTRARTDRIAKEADYLRLQEAQKAGTSLDGFPAVLASGFIQQLKTELASLQRREAELAERLGDRHPDMLKVRSAIQTADAKLQAEISQVVQSVRNEYLIAQREEQSLQNALNDQKSEAQRLNRRAIEYGALERDAASNRQLFEALLQRTKEIGVSGELRTSNIRIIDPAEVPRSSTYPNRTMNLVLGFVAALLLALGFVFTVDVLDNRIKSPAELKSAVQVPFLGSIPVIEGRHEKLLVNNGVPPQFVESLRTLRSNVLFSAPDGHRSVVVTSTVPGEGKTVVASNLALSLAMAGQRVLLVDADMRRPRLHAIFGVTREPGLSNVIVGEAKPTEAIRKTAAENVWLLPAGHLPPNPPELLGSRQFTEMLAGFAEHFEWVILDAPPVMGVTDAAVVGHAAGGVLFVVGSEMTTRSAARSALEQLDAARVTYVGAVLNRTDLHGHPYYYYYAH